MSAPVTHDVEGPPAGVGTPLARWVGAADHDWVRARMGAEVSAAALEAGGVLLTGLAATDREALIASELGPEHLGAEACWLSGPRARLRAWAQTSKDAPQQARIAAALLRALEVVRPQALTLSQGALGFGAGPLVMGVINVTPDSFSDGGRFVDPAHAIAHGLRLVEEGADLLDLGGESTRPGAAAVSAQQELDRVLPVIQALRERVAIPISIDTTKATVARAALEAGAVLVNDVSGFTFDPQMARVTADSGAAACLQHIQGTPETMQQAPRYGDVVAEVLGGLADRLRAAQGAGVASDRLVLDPGIGFGKTAAHNLFLLRRLGDLRQLGRPLLVGTSRKAFLGTLTGRPPGERLAATLGSLVMLAAEGAVDIVRVHDVAGARDALNVAQAIRTARGGGDHFGG